jgi:hypothetical protein
MKAGGRGTRMLAPVFVCGLLLLSWSKCSSEEELIDQIRSTSSELAFGIAQSSPKLGQYT